MSPVLARQRQAKLWSANMPDPGKFSVALPVGQPADRLVLTPSALNQYFDGVVMLTWSDWRTEPRSNRYHYATRFARSLPVLFVQPDGVGRSCSFEETEVPGV